MIPGEIILGAEPIVINATRAVRPAVVVNTGDRPVQVGSHFHFAEVNDALAFDRAAANGTHLGVAAGTSVRFEPGIEQTVELVDFAGRRVAAGFRGHVAGPIDG